MPLIAHSLGRRGIGSALIDACWVAAAAYRLAVARVHLALRPGRVLISPPTRRDRPFGVTSARLALAVERAARRLPFTPTCLERAIAVQHLLSLTGVEGTLVIGVRRDGNTLDAHAWIERDGHALFGAPPPGRYTPLLSR